MAFPPSGTKFRVPKGSTPDKVYTLVIDPKDMEFRIHWDENGRPEQAKYAFNEMKRYFETGAWVAVEEKKAIGTHDTYIPGLGVCGISGEYGRTRRISVEVSLDQIKKFGKPILAMECGNCDREYAEGFENDYLCIECREMQGDVSFSCDLEELLK